MRDETSANVPASSSPLFESAFDALEEFRRLEPDMPIQFVSGFLSIAAFYLAHEDWPRIADLRASLDVTQQSASRIAQGLSGGRRGSRGSEQAGRRSGKSGLGLIVKRPDPRDARAVRLALTERGEDLLARLTQIIG